MGPTEAVARFALEAPAGLPAGVLAAARRAVLDTVGVALGGSAEPVARALAEYAGTSAGPCRLWGQPGAVAPSQAALVNGAAAHALDFDDISHAMRGRPSAAVLPAVVALAERLQASGAAMLAAYAVGVEIECKLGAMSARSTYERGWQTSCTLGAIGGAAACSRLLGLDLQATRQAIGLAVAQASGSRRGFGSMAKPFQLGRASQAAVMAAELAALGVSGPVDAIEGEAGYFDLYSDQADRDGDRLRAALGHPFELEEPGFNVKLYPCGGAAHPSIDGVLALREGLQPDEIERIVADVSYTAPLVAHQQRPRTGLEGKFSLGYCLAAAVLDGQVGLAQFTDAAVNRPAAQALLARVEARVPDDMRKGATPRAEGRVEIHLRDGSVRRHEVAVRRGTGNVTPLTEAELDAKFRSCASLALSSTQVQTALETARRVDRLGTVAELTAILSGS
jgi:2-methylcitrate dehydratase PrpD